MDRPLTADQERYLLRLAREAITHYLEKGKPLEREPPPGEVWREKRGAFVTLRVDDQLRGCIGYPLPIKPLYETILDAAVAAATQDFRFRPIDLEELPRTRIEISVLSRPESIREVNLIEVGKHGIVVSKGLQKGLLLPQVAVEHGWDRETFLRHGCLKAGLEEDAWKRDARIEIFTAQVFSE